MEWQYVVTIVGSIVGATGLFKFIEFLISRRDNYSTRDSSVSKEIEGIKSDIKSVKELIERYEAIHSRVRILSAADEFKHGKTMHSEEYFDQINDDITKYEAYCNNHPGFKNNKAAHSIEFINTIYQKALRENNFLR